MLEEVQLFMAGLKPAILLAEQQSDFQYVADYPSVPIHLLENRHQQLFFRTEKERDDWITHTQDVDHQSLVFHQKLGIVLGYPPKAVKHYVNRLKLQKENINLDELSKVNSKSIGLHYAGIACNSNIDDLVDNVRWLWDTYQQDKMLNVRHDTSLIAIQYRDETELKNVYNQLHKMLDTVAL